MEKYLNSLKFMKTLYFCIDSRKRKEIRAHVQAQYEADLELQLKRQASAHSMHLHDELEQQQQKITEQFEAKIKNEIDDIVAQYKVQLETGFHSLYRIYHF